MPKDPLCPLGFHPQVRWPTRCKRCFREYKEHAPKKEDIDRGSMLMRRSASTDTPSTSSTEDKDFSTPYSSLSSAARERLSKHRSDIAAADDKKPSSSYLSPPEIGSGLRRNTTDLSQFVDPEQNLYPNSISETFTVKLKKAHSFNAEPDGEDVPSSPTPPPRSKTPSPVPTFDVSDSGDKDKEPKGKKSPKSSSPSLLLPGEVTGDSKVKKTKKKRLLIQGVQEVTQPRDDSSSPSSLDDSMDDGAESSADVAFIIQVKSSRNKKKKDDDDETMSMTTTTETTETTLVDVMANNAAGNSGVDGGVSVWEYEEVKKEVDRLKEKCDKLEKEKADILTRRVSNLEAPKAQSAEYIKLQQKVNQLTSANEDLKDEQKHFETRVRELEKELGARPTNDFMQRTVAELRSKLVSAETEIDKLNEDKRDALQQMRDMQYEFEEMQDSFREEQSEEFATIKKELDEATKNCRLLQFKLRKVEKRCDQVEAEKKELELRIESDKNSGKLAKLEQELARIKLENEKLRAGAPPGTMAKLDLSPKIAKKKSPVLTKAPSGETVEPPVTSEVDPAQLLCDLQSSVERESDLREQLKFAEEECHAMMQKICRIEEENESLLIQVKKMSTAGSKLGDGGKGKGATAPVKVNGSGGTTAGGDSATDLKLQLEINEQESTILRHKVEDLEKSNTKLSKEIHMYRDKIESLEKAAKLNVVKSPNVDEVSILRRKLIEKEREIDRIQGELATAKTKTKGIRDKSIERRTPTAPAPPALTNQELEAAKAELKRVQDEVAKLKAESARQINQAGDQLNKVKTDTETLEKRNYQLSESNKTLLGHIEKFKKDISTMKEHYEAIQDDFVLKNSNLLSEKEKLEKSRLVLAKEYDTIEKELKALRETFNTRQDTWIKEKLAMEERMREMEMASQKRNIPNDTGTGSQDGSRLKHLLREQSTELDSQKRELSLYKDQIMSMQKENDELRRQMEDFEKLSQHQIRNLSANDSGQKLEKEMKAIRERLHLEEKQHKNEVAQMKLRHEQEIALKGEEISAVHSQLNRAKRERDTFRQMVDSAQRAIAELKSRGDRDTNLRRDSLSSGLEEAATGARAAVATLQERVVALEDDLAESKRETARAKTELATENSAWEMKFGELQQKINELEEDKLLASGRNRAAGQKTRLELAWQKEREEQQRRLKEATTLARDLKTTLQEIEREREREKIEAKRRLEQTKLALEEDQEEMKRKISESQCDLLELRDAHAKLRTANEKLRRDREKLEKDKEIQTKKELEIRRVYLERDKILDKLVNHLTALSASPQPQLGGKANLGEILTYLNNIKQLKEPEDLTQANAKDKRKSNFRRTASAGEGDDVPPPRDLTISSSAYGKEHYGTAGNVTRVTRKYVGSTSGSSVNLPPSRGRTPTPSESGSTGSGTGATLQRTSKSRASDKTNDSSKGSLYRKSLSLEQNVSMPDEQKIWKGDSDAGSASSLKSIDSRGSSIDRFSTLSSKSEKPKSLVGKMKKFVKSRSIEDSPTAELVMRAGVQAAGIASNSSSISSLTSETEGSKVKESSGKRLKDKVKGIFRRSSRSPSVERVRSAGGVVLPPPGVSIGSSSSSSSQVPVPPSRPSRENTPKRDSTQRPLMPVESTQRPLMPSRR